MRAEELEGIAGEVHSLLFGGYPRAGLDPNFGFCGEYPVNLSGRGVIVIVLGTVAGPHTAFAESRSPVES